MVNENNAYAAIKRGAFPGVWKRVTARGLGDYFVYYRAPKLADWVVGRQFFVEVKEVDTFEGAEVRTFNLHLRPAQIPFFKSWPGEKYVLVRASDTKKWAWFSGKERFVVMGDQVECPFKR